MKDRDLAVSSILAFLALLILVLGRALGWD